MGFHPSLSKLCLWVCFVILQCRGCFGGCAGDERAALLEIKASRTRRFPDYYLSTWVEDKTSDYCAWEYIKCSDTTGCVSQLHLELALRGDSLLNASLFLPFKDLEYLDISNNGFNGWKSHQGINKLAKLKKLLGLDLGWNEFNINVLEPLSELTSLRTLYLDNNNLGDSSLSEISQGIHKLAKLKKLQDLKLGHNQFNINILEALSDFTSLRTLYLDGNHLGESSSSEISQGIHKLAKLKKLQDLKLGYNRFNINVLEALSDLTSLRILYLDGNYLGESSSSEISQGILKLSNLKKLDVLSLCSNNLNTKILAPLAEITSLETLYLCLNNIGEGSTSEISQGFKNLLKLKRLQFLDLKSNNLNHTSILVSLSKLTSLQHLNLSWNQLRMGSSIEISQGFCELKKLQGIDLSYNNLNGEIPLCLVNFTSLRMLDLSFNQLGGNIPTSLTSNMTSLGRLDLSDNELGGNIPISLTSNMTSLKKLDLSNNHFTGTTWITSSLEQNFQLKYLGLSNCNLNTSTTSLLKFLHGQSELRFIDLSHNNIHGNFPNWLLANNTKLTTIALKNNSLSGDVHFPLHRRLNLWFIDISKNHIGGRLQTNLGQVLQRVEYLYLSQNHLEGSIPTSLGNMRYLWALDLSNNNFTGEIPGSLGGLRIMSLILSNNRLHGQIFLNSSSYNQVVRLNNNQFTGIVPYNTNTKWILSTLDVSKNNISGRIPSWIANITTVEILIMGDNFFHGSIPLELCNIASLEFLDLSQNELSGNIPSCLNLSYLRYMQFEGNKLSGSLPPAILRSPKLEALNLNHNNFSGSIPGWLALLENLRILLLNRNRLSGFVPYKLCRSSKISIMDLSHNGLSGKIPSCLSNISFGQSGGFLHDFEVQDQNTETYPLDDYADMTDLRHEFKSYVSQEEVEFITKGLSSSYKGDILTYMSGMDLSCNNFTGHIPHELEALTAIHALNLSHNQLTGPIPRTLSQLKQLESMDLSHNKLSGEIPSELTDLNFLGTFSVAYNNLSGHVPTMNQQFSTFNETSYEGNPYLCGPPLLKQCNSVAAPTGSVTATNAALSDVFGIDPISFLASCVGAYVVSLMALVIVLYINPYWRRLWFDFIDACLGFMFPFWAEAFYRVPNPFT